MSMMDVLQHDDTVDIDCDNGTNTYYALLQITPDASTAAIAKAYRQLALQTHPDKNPKDITTAQQRFLAISHAYTILSDPAKRKLYDLYGPSLQPMLYASFLHALPLIAAMTIAFSSAGIYRFGYIKHFETALSIQIGCAFLTNLIHRQKSLTQKRIRTQIVSVSDYIAVTSVGIVIGNIGGWVGASGWVYMRALMRAMSSSKR